MNNEPPKISLINIKKYITIATIVLISLCAFLGIVAIFVGTNTTILQVLSTLLIMYLVLLYSTNNILRLENQLSLVRGLSIATLVANCFWSILWIALVWDVFGSFSIQVRDTIWRIVGSAAVISAFCTVLSAKVAQIYYLPTIMKFFKSLPLVCAAFLGIDMLLVIWVNDMDEEIIYKLVLAELILVALQAIVTKILVSNAVRLGINGVSEPPQSSSATSYNSPTGPQGSQPTGGTPVQEKAYEEELREQIEREVRAKIAIERAEQKNQNAQNGTK